MTGYEFVTVFVGGPFGLFVLALLAWAAVRTIREMKYAECSACCSKVPKAANRCRFCGAKF